MRRLILPSPTAAALSGCASTGASGEPESYGVLRNAFSGAHRWAWTPEFAPDGSGAAAARR